MESCLLDFSSMDKFLSIGYYSTPYKVYLLMLLYNDARLLSDSVGIQTDHKCPIIACFHWHGSLTAAHRQKTQITMY